MAAKVLGVTGLVGAGKSVVLQALSTLYGIPVFDCDREAKLLYRQPQVRAKLIEELRVDPIDTDGAIDKSEIQALLSEKSTKQHLEQIIHEAVTCRFLEWHEQQHTRWVALESAILFTSGIHKICDHTLAVTATKEVRRERVLRRDRSRGTEGFELLERLQLAEEERQRYEVDFKIDNSGDGSLIKAVEAIGVTLSFIDA